MYTWISVVGVIQCVMRCRLGPHIHNYRFFLLDFYQGLCKTSWVHPIYAEVSSRAIPFHCKVSCYFCLPAHIAALLGRTDSVHLNYCRKCHFGRSLIGRAAEQNHTTLCLLCIWCTCPLSPKLKCGVGGSALPPSFKLTKKWTWKGTEPVRPCLISGRRLVDATVDYRNIKFMEHIFCNAIGLLIKRAELSPPF